VKAIVKGWSRDGKEYMSVEQIRPKKGRQGAVAVYANHHPARKDLLCSFESSAIEDLQWTEE
jgi:hypothetical protein